MSLFWEEDENSLVSTCSCRKRTIIFHRHAVAAAAADDNVYHHHHRRRHYRKKRLTRHAITLMGSSRDGHSL
jgi:hypothetical protein